MSYFISQKMTYCEAFVPSQIGWDVFHKLGYDEIVHLQSNIINYQNPFVRNYRRCEETIVKINLLRGMLNQFKDWIHFRISQVKNQETVWRQILHRIQQSNREGCFYINQIQDQVHHSHGYLSVQLLQIQNLKKKMNELVLQTGLLVTISKQQRFLAFYGAGNGMPDIEGVIRHRNNMFQSKCVCINRKDLLMLKRSIFRITRGNNWIYQFQIKIQDLNRYFGAEKHRKTAQQLLKNKIACLIIYSKGERNILNTKINRLLSCLDCHILNTELANIRDQVVKLQRKITQIQTIEEITFQTVSKHIHKLVQVKNGSQVSWLSYMQLYTKRQRQIYRALSTTTVSKNLLRFNMFIPSSNLPLNIQPKPNLPPLILNVKQTNKMPPSKFDKNCMLEVPQEIVNTYGVPSYKEINPAPFYIVTFGFFIGVMFGDIGHMLMAIPLLIYLKANKWFWTVIFFMGYCGLIYNQFFGLNLGLFSSCYTTYSSGQNSKVEHDQNCVYTIGIDSVWKTSQNNMQFTNSLKMKMAVILGVIHMLFGLILRLINNVRQKKYVDLIMLTLPQIIFMACTFVYMDFLIIYKWSTNYQDTKNAPSIISTMIAVYVNMAQPNPRDKLFWQGQRHQQKVIIAIAFSIVPIMLLGKSIVVCIQRRRRNAPQTDQIEMHELQQQNDHENDEGQRDSNQEMKNRELHSPKFKNFNQNQHQQPLKQIIVHQFIETIEFVLGSVSNTASYLRLWALSLAHAQLSQVIFELTVLKSLSGGYQSLIGLFLVFPFFFAITFGVLICMDSLQCFLHSLRLHWVQFQNKFYQGKGYLFEPFSFKKLK